MFHLKLYAGSPNAARYGDVVSSHFSIEEAVKAGREAMAYYAPAYPDDAGTRGFKVEDEQGKAVHEED